MVFIATTRNLVAYRAHGCIFPSPLLQLCLLTLTSASLFQGEDVCEHIRARKKPRSIPCIIIGSLSSSLLYIARCSFQAYIGVGYLSKLHQCSRQEAQISQVSEIRVINKRRRKARGRIRRNCWEFILGELRCIWDPLQFQTWLVPSFSPSRNPIPTSSCSPATSLGKTKPACDG